jgi:hypothetical protein
VLGRLGHRTIDLVILLFALYAFAFLPLGRRTGLEHLKAILGTREAEEASDELVEAGDRLKQKILRDGFDVPRGRPVLPDLPKGAPVQMRVAPMETADAGADSSLGE